MPSTGNFLVLLINPRALLWCYFAWNHPFLAAFYKCETSLLTKVLLMWRVNFIIIQSQKGTTWTQSNGVTGSIVPGWYSPFSITPVWYNLQLYPLSGMALLSKVSPVPLTVCSSICLYSTVLLNVTGIVIFLLGVSSEFGSAGNLNVQESTQLRYNVHNNMFTNSHSFGTLYAIKYVQEFIIHQITI